MKQVIVCWNLCEFVSKPMKLLVGGISQTMGLGDSKVGYQIKLLAICCPIKNLLFFNANCLPCSGLA